MDKKTLIVNLFAQPDTGKSTTAAMLFAELKIMGVRAELVQEYAKQCVWLGDMTRLTNQAYVTAKQYFRQCVAHGQVDVLVTDSPILLGIHYRGQGCPPSFDPYVLDLFHEFWNYNVWLGRPDNRAYDPAGRMQNEAQAQEAGHQLHRMLGRFNIGLHYEIANPGVAKRLARRIACELTTERTPEFPGFSKLAGLAGPTVYPNAQGGAV